MPIGPVTPQPADQVLAELAVLRAENEKLHAVVDAVRARLSEPGRIAKAEIRSDLGPYA